jgi:protein-S-isoprenylcysteine O-methyltransferase Ste14
MVKMTPHMINAALWTAFWLSWLGASFTAKRNASSEGAWGRAMTVLPIAAAMLLMFHDRRWAWLGGQYHRNEVVAWVGVAETTAGMTFAAWARLHLGRYWSGVVALKEGHKVIRSGPYRFVRHPIYAGLLLAALGTTITAGTWDAAAGFTLWLVVWLFKIRKEERVLIGALGEEYRTFMRDVPALLPGIY